MPATDTFKDLLATRLRLRTTGGACCYELDLRGKRFNNHGVMTVRCPDDPAWPSRGRTTDDLALATRWVREHYADFLQTEHEVTALSRDLSGITVGQACARYMAAIEEEKGADHNTCINRRYDIRKHILPRFEHLPLSSLTTTVVWPWLNELKVDKGDGRGGYRKVEAKHATKRGLRATLVAVWEEVAPHVPCPYKGVLIKGGSDMRAWRQRIADGDLAELLKPKSGAMTPAQVLQVLAAAAYYDRKLASTPNIARRSVPNTLLAIVVALATGVRVAELRTLRWEHIKEKEGIIYILGTKTKSALRIVPLQQQLRPWLAALRQLSRPADAPPDWEPAPSAPVFFTNPARPGQLASTRTITARIAEVLRLAGLKQPGKTCHWTRATFATWASRERQLLSKESLKAYLGHTNAWGGATDEYIEELIELMKPGHRRVIRHLPTPAEVQTALTTFTPVELPHWQSRRPRWSPRKKTQATVSA